MCISLESIDELWLTYELGSTVFSALPTIPFLLTTSLLHSTT
jgi:hypothetical protein